MMTILWCQDIWKRLYRVEVESQTDKGTLYQLRNLIKRYM